MLDVIDKVVHKRDQRENERYILLMADRPVVSDTDLPESDEIAVDIIMKNDLTASTTRRHRGAIHDNHHPIEPPFHPHQSDITTHQINDDNNNDMNLKNMNILLAFGLLGLLNNCPYVIMLANAKFISEGGVAAVYIANIIPGLLVQITAPYWFDIISYHIRLRLATIAMMIAFLFVAYFSDRSSSTYSKEVVFMGQLLGVALISFQCGLGEASLLALAGKWDASRTEHHSSRHSDDTINSNDRGPMDDVPNEHDAIVHDSNSNSNSNSISNNNTKESKGYYLSAFAMGTGMAGPIGFLWKMAWNEWMGFSVSTSLCIAAVVLSMAYGILCTQLVLWSHQLLPLLGTFTRDQYSVIRTEVEGEGSAFQTVSHAIEETIDTYQPPVVTEPDDDDVDRDGLIREYNTTTNDEHHILPQPPPPSSGLLPALTDLSAFERFRLLLRMCWVYMIPLFVVYAAEYACQAGAWTTIGFPTVTDSAARIQFFERSNWLYQAGVFVSRSTGSLLSINIIGLWIMPAIQVLNLLIFSMTASTGIQVPRSILYHQSILLSLSFFTGLLGGAVYVHGYNRIVRDVPKQYTEFAVASTSVAVSFGVLVADIIGLYLQSCLYQSNGLDGALVQCPFS